jgi:hypothetical protein
LCKSGINKALYYKSQMNNKRSHYTWDHCKDL